MINCRFTTYQNARRVTVSVIRLVDGLVINIIETIFYEYHPLSDEQL